MFAWPRSARIPPPGRPMLPEQQLDDRRGADVLDADGVLGPAHRVARAPRCARGPEFSHSASATSQEVSRGNAAELLHQLGRVAAEVALQDLEHAARVLEVEVHLGRQSPSLERDAVRAVRLLARDVAPRRCARSTPA